MVLGLAGAEAGAACCFSLDRASVFFAGAVRPALAVEEAEEEEEDQEEEREEEDEEPERDLEPLLELLPEELTEKDGNFIASESN